MVAINSHFAEPVRKGPGRRPESVDPSDLIWRLHQVIADPTADLRSAKRAKAQLLRTVTDADESLRITFPPMEIFAARKNVRVRPQKTFRPTETCPSRGTAAVLAAYRL